MVDVFPDLPDHPDYLSVAAEVSEFLEAGAPKLAINRPVRIAGARKCRQAWTWTWIETEDLRPHLDHPLNEPIVVTKRSCSIVIDVHDPWHGQPFHGYEIKINGMDGLYITLESRNRSPVTLVELRRALRICRMLPQLTEVWTAAPEDEGYSW